MALTKDKKSEVVSEVSKLLQNSKLTVIARYQGTSVKSMQALRLSARENGTVIRVIKNRLFQKAIEADDRFKDVNSDLLTGQLIYAFNPTDELAPAQSLANFAKNEPQIQFVGGLNLAGQFIEAEEVATLASLPGKDQLKAQLAGTIAAPLGGFVSVMAANVKGLLNVLNARVETAGQ